MVSRMAAPARWSGGGGFERGPGGEGGGTGRRDDHEPAARCQSTGDRTGEAGVQPVHRADAGQHAGRHAVRDAADRSREAGDHVGLQVGASWLYVLQPAPNARQSVYHSRSARHRCTHSQLVDPLGEAAQGLDARAFTTSRVVARSPDRFIPASRRVSAMAAGMPDNLKPVKRSCRRPRCGVWMRAVRRPWRCLRSPARPGGRGSPGLPRTRWVRAAGSCSDSPRRPNMPETTRTTGRAVSPRS
jgi:hypothetical protein